MERETKSKDLTLVADFMSFDFARNYRPLSKKDVPSMWLRWWLGSGFDSPAGWKRAREIQKAVVTAHTDGNLEPLVDNLNRHLRQVFWEVDKRIVTPRPVITRPESYLYSSLVHVIAGGQFWQLKRCAECSRFFLGKRKYCDITCLKKRNSLTAQRRVEKARAKKRFDEIFPKLLRLQKAAKETARPLELLDKLLGFNHKLLADIIDGKKPLKELASQVKYKNRKILVEAKI
jgi:hypothetical protein